MPEDANDIQNWGVKDPKPGELLETILPFSVRAKALIARNSSHPILRTDFLQIRGAVSMMRALDYHRDRFVDIIRCLASGTLMSDETALHEAVAYVNRGGQFYYFSQYDLVKQRGECPPIPLLETLMHFRNKHTAHRSIDVPRKTDTEHLQAYQAMSMDFDGRSFLPREGVTVEATLESALFPWRTGYLVFQINLGEGRFHFLNIERDHEALMREALSILEFILIPPDVAAA
jgi:hypothetical protein